ncbi:MAG TPA: hypothetical protein VMO26_27370 [Vicinamibacterales bacterium]|nr:hypothetical protein [Vicinamibacterales bacterium]
MPEAAFLELLASFEAALNAATRSVTIAQALAEGYRTGVRPPEVVLDAYFASFERDQVQLAALREKVLQFKLSLPASQCLPAAGREPVDVEDREQRRT